jgi:hypothetical protein
MILNLLLFAISCFLRGVVEIEVLLVENEIGVRGDRRRTAEAGVSSTAAAGCLKKAPAGRPGPRTDLK